MAQLHAVCPDHPDDKRAANGKCIGCIADKWNRLSRVQTHLATQ